MYTEQVFYNSGELWAIGSDVNLTPAPFGTLQDVTLDFSYTEKELRGQNLFPEEVAQSEAKITGKAKFGRIDLALFNAQYFNGTLAAGSLKVSYQEAATVPASPGPYTVVVANAATYKDDLGVQYAANPFQRMEKVASTPAAGQYSVNTATGTYTFAAADAGTPLLISYSYAVAGSGHTVTVTNQLAGQAPYFSVLLRNTYKGNEAGLKLYRCTSSKLSLATKLGDFMIPEFDFTALADSSGNVLSFWGL